MMSMQEQRRSKDVEYLIIIKFMGKKYYLCHLGRNYVLTFSNILIWDKIPTSLLLLQSTHGGVNNLITGKYSYSNRAKPLYLTDGWAVAFGQRQRFIANLKVRVVEFIGYLITGN